MLYALEKLVCHCCREPVLTMIGLETIPVYPPQTGERERSASWKRILIGKTKTEMEEEEKDPSSSRARETPLAQGDRVASPCRLLQVDRKEKGRRRTFLHVKPDWVLLRRLIWLGLA